MWVVFLINLLIAAFLAFFSFKNRHEAFNLFNAGIVFIVFGLVLLISAIPVFKNFDTSSVLMFTAGLLGNQIRKSSQDKRHCCYSSSRSSLFDLSYSKLEYDKHDRA